MSAEPTVSAPPTGATDVSDEYEVIHLGGETAAVVPLYDLRRMRALERRASSEELEEAEATAAFAEMDEWEAAGRPGAISHEAFMAEILGSDK